MAHNIRDLLGEWYGDTLPTDNIDTDLTVGVTAVQLVTANARRYKLRVTNLGGANIVIGKDFTVTTTTGFVVISPGTTLEMNAFDDLEDVTRRWIAISSAAGTAVHTLETVLTGTDACSN